MGKKDLKRSSVGEPILNLSGSAGITALTQNLTINGTTVSPFIRYEAGDATAASWTGVVGPTLTAASSGDEPTIEGCPLPSDSTVLYQGGAIHEAPNATLGNISGGDVVIELVFVTKSDFTNSDGLVSKRNTSNDGWLVYTTNTGTLGFNINDDDAGTETLYTSALDAGTYYHAMCFADFSGSAQWYINGVANGSADDISSIGDIDTEVPLLIGSSREDYLNKAESGITYVSMWKSSSWLDTHLQATVATERFQRLTGIYPNRPVSSISSSRASAAHSDVSDGTTRKTYSVGDGWIRQVKRYDSTSEAITGFLIEEERTNRLLNSEDFTGWDLIDGADLIATADAYSTPDILAQSDAFVASANNGAHGVTQQVTLGADGYTFSVWAKAGAQDHLYLANQDVEDCDGYFDLTNGSVPYLGTGATGIIEDWGGDWYRCGINFTAASGSNTLVIQPAVDSSTAAFAGDGATIDGYMWGAQCEGGVSDGYWTTYIPTTTSEASRQLDSLSYTLINTIDSQGSIVADVFLDSRAITAGEGRIVSLSDGTTDNRMEISANSSANPKLCGYSGGTAVVSETDTTTDLTDGNQYKVSGSYQANNNVIYIDGVEK